ncbi:Alpha-(1,3)-Fucosyltransferase 11 [Manis pentadactyla]|nr:Alpha-(1,3)-Fucosyltransferase 11 [Manis pentadactyla]
MLKGEIRINAGALGGFGHASSSRIPCGDPGQRDCASAGAAAGRGRRSRENTTRYRPKHLPGSPRRRDPCAPAPRLPHYTWWKEGRRHTPFPHPCVRSVPF